MLGRRVVEFGVVLADTRRDHGRWGAPLFPEVPHQHGLHFWLRTLSAFCAPALVSKVPLISTENSTDCTRCPHCRHYSCPLIAIHGFLTLASVFRGCRGN
jgi:hypothetical protein